MEAESILKIDHKLLWMVLIKIIPVYGKNPSDDYTSKFYKVRGIFVPLAKEACELFVIILIGDFHFVIWRVFFMV